MNPRALSRIRVCDVSTGMVGPMATRWLAAFGAQVIKVEDLSTPDPVRLAGPYRDERRGEELSAGFNNANAGKWGVAFDLGTGRGRGLLTELVATGDVLCLDQRLDDLGLRLDDINEFRSGHDPELIVIEGAGAQAGDSDGEMLAAAHCATWILLALWHREQTGEGRRIDLGRTALLTSDPAPADEMVDGPTLRGLFRCASTTGASPSEEWVAIDCRDEGDQAALKVVMDLGQDALEGSNDPVGQWCSHRSRWQVESELTAVGVPAAAVRQADERVDADIATGARHLWPMVDHAEMGGIRIEGIPVELSRTSWALTEPAPLLGQDTHYVLAEILNRNGSEIERLRTLGIVALA